MNNEIKEMNLSEMLFNRDELLLDYITNLQQENEMMRKLIDEGVENSYKKLKYLQQENEELKEANKILEENWKHYMMICGKASEDIKFCLHSIKQEYEMSTDERTRNEMESCVQIFNKTLNILQNGSDSQ